jgi:hypothetical protein
MYNGVILGLPTRGGAAEWSLGDTLLSSSCKGNQRWFKVTSQKTLGLHLANPDTHIPPNLFCPLVRSRETSFLSDRILFLIFISNEMFIHNYLLVPIDFLKVLTKN